VVSNLGWSGDSVGAVELTYGQAQEKYPELAAASSLVEDPNREVWVVTDYFPPETVPRAGGWGPPGSEGYVTISAATVVVDATTGRETDWCEGCATIPASAS
jgi:hypothetical protein